MSWTLWVLSVLWTCVPAAHAVAHDPVPPVAQTSGTTPSPVRSFLERGLGDAQAYTMLRELCTLAPHRLAGSEGLDRALAWGEAALQRAGADKVYRVPTLVPHWDRGTLARLELVAPAGSTEPAVTWPILALGGSIATPKEGLEAPVVRVVGRQQLAALGARAKGAIVFYDEPFDPSKLSVGEAYGGAVWQRGSGAIEAAKLGAVAVVVRSVTASMDDHPHTGAMRYEEGVPKIPAVAISTKGAVDLARRVEQGTVQLRLQLDCQTLPDKPSANIVGELTGTDPAAGVVLLSGHIDAWDIGQGAHDDAAGCVHAIEALRLLKKDGWRGKRTLRVVLYTNEENGVRGGLAQREATPQGEVRLALESDSGGFAPVGLSVDASGPLKAALEGFGRELQPIFAGTVVQGGGGVDVGPLKERGAVVGLLLISGARYFDHHHCALDVADNVHPRELQLGAVAYAAWGRFACDLDEAVYVAEARLKAAAAAGSTVK